jgi:hypothetical protein
MISWSLRNVIYLYAISFIYIPSEVRNSPECSALNISYQKDTEKSISDLFAEAEK